VRKAPAARHCGGKVAHDDKADAVGHAHHLRRTQGKTAAQANVYKCRACSKWHVGRRPGSSGKRRRKAS
jgi:hypothetical protein